MPEVYDVRGVLAPEDMAVDCSAWLWWVDPTGVRSSTSQTSLSSILPEQLLHVLRGADALGL